MNNRHSLQHKSNRIFPSQEGQIDHLNTHWILSENLKLSVSWSSTSPRSVSTTTTAIPFISATCCKKRKHSIIKKKRKKKNVTRQLTERTGSHCSQFRVNTLICFGKNSHKVLSLLAVGMGKESIWSTFLRWSSSSANPVDIIFRVVGVIKVNDKFHVINI